MRPDINRLLRKQNRPNIFILTDRYVNRAVNIITFKLEMRFDSGWVTLRAVIGACVLNQGQYQPPSPPQPFTFSTNP
jgi:hypothetical protein